ESTVPSGTGTNYQSVGAGILSVQPAPGRQPVRFIERRVGRLAENTLLTGNDLAPVSSGNRPPAERAGEPQRLDVAHAGSDPSTIGVCFGRPGISHFLRDLLIRGVAVVDCRPLSRHEAVLHVALDQHRIAFTRRAIAS